MAGRSNRSLWSWSPRSRGQCGPWGWTVHKGSGSPREEGKVIIKVLGEGLGQEGNCAQQ